MVEARFRRVPTILDVLRRAWAKATDEERQAFAAGADGGEVERLRADGRG